MALTQIFQFFDTFSKTKKQSEKLSPTTENLKQTETDTWPQVERRQANLRRFQERRNMHCQPYIDTRKNHGRRRSLGRRADDQSLALPY